MGRLRIGNGRWMKQVGKIVTEKVSEVMQQDDGDGGGDWMDRAVGDGNLQDKFHDFIEMTKKCRIISQETIDLCQQTEQQHDRMIQFTEEIKSTFMSSGLVVNEETSNKEATEAATTEPSTPDNDNDSNNNDILKIIKDLTDGDKVKEAMEIAKGIRDIAEKCINQSTELSTLMGQGIDTLLPDWIQKMMPSDDDDDKNNDDDDDDDNVDMKEVNDSMKGIETDINDMKQCLDDIQNNMNIHNAISIGCNTFLQLHDKSKRSSQMFQYMKQYANDIYEITHSGINQEKILSGQVKVRTIIDIVKSASRIVQYSDIMKLCSQCTNQLLNKLIELFDVTSKQVSQLWSALSYAKDCMKQCMKCMDDTKTTCTTVQSTTTDFMTHSTSLSTEFQQFRTIEEDGSTNQSQKLVALMPTLRSFMNKDGHLQETIRIAKNMDDMILQCTERVMTMIQTIQDGFNNFPPILRPKLSDATTNENNEKSSSNPTTTSTPSQPDETKSRGDVNIPESTNSNSSNKTEETDEVVIALLKQLDETKNEIETSDIMTAMKNGEKYFIFVTDSMKNQCCTMMESIQNYNTKSIDTISSFIHIWDIRSISNKIVEMTSMMEYGNHIRSLAKSLQRILQSMIAYLQSALHKYTTMPTITAESGTEMLQNVISNDAVQGVVEDVVGNVVDQMKGKFHLFRK